MAGMTEREVEGRSVDGAGVPYTKSEARHFCTMTGRLRPRPESKAPKHDAMRWIQMMARDSLTGHGPITSGCWD
jgi:hypothetical protein